jgi:cytidine deaminase
VSAPNLDLAALLRAASDARAGAYAPYSRFAVGAAVAYADGGIVTGCNIENASYGLTMCAERVALFTGHASGKRGVVALAVAGPPGKATPPCGACRQVMNEWNPRMLVVCADAAGAPQTLELQALLPHAFGPGNLDERGA